MSEESPPLEQIASQLRQNTNAPLDAARQADTHINQAIVLVTEVAGTPPDASLVEMQVDAASASTYAAAAVMRLANGQEDLNRYADVITSSGAEQAVYTPVIPAERTYGDTHYTVALSTHNNTTLKDMAQVVAGCDAIAIEAVGGMTAAQRAELQELYNLMLTPGLDPALVQAQFDTLKQADPSVIPRILEQFIGTGKIVYLIDMAVDHPEYPKVAKRAKDMEHLKEMVLAAAPIQLTRHVMRAAIEDTADANRERNALLGYQLQWLDGQLQPGTKVGVVMGKEHYDVLNMLDPSASDKTQEVRDHLSETENLWVQTLISSMETGEIPSITLDRLTLGTYIDTYSQTDYRSDMTLPHMTDQQIENVFAAVQHATNAPRSRQEKAEALRAYCTSVSQRFTPQASTAAS